LRVDYVNYGEILKAITCWTPPEADATLKESGDNAADKINEQV